MQRRWTVSLAVGLWMVGCGFFGFPAPERAKDDGAGEGGAPPSGGSSGASGSQGGVAGDAANGGTGGDVDQGGTAGSTSGAAGAGEGGTAGTIGGTAGTEVGGTGGDGGSAGQGPTLGVTQGLTLWLDAASLTGSGDLATWPNRVTGGESDASQPTEAARPELTLDGTRPGVAFDGTRYMVFEEGFANFTLGLSFFVVARFEPRVGCDELLQFSTGPEMDDISFQADIDEFDNPGVFLFEVFDGSLTTNPGALGGARPQLVSVVATPPDDVRIFLNQITAGGAIDDGLLPANVSRTRNFLGSGLYTLCDPFRGVVFELLLYNRALTTNERELVSGYLQDKWDCCDG